jgi:hypothetical protein
MLGGRQLPRSGEHEEGLSQDAALDYALARTTHNAGSSSSSAMWEGLPSYTPNMVFGSGEVAPVQWQHVVSALAGGD